MGRSATRPWRGWASSLGGKDDENGRGDGGEGLRNGCGLGARNGVRVYTRHAKGVFENVVFIFKH